MAVTATWEIHVKQYAPVYILCRSEKMLPRKLPKSMENSLFSRIRDLSAFHRPAIDSPDLKSILELCFDCFKSLVPGVPAVVGPWRGGGWSRPSVCYGIHIENHRKVMQMWLSLCGIMDGLMVSTSLRLAADRPPPGPPAPLS